jgi:hypothetical protein
MVQERRRAEMERLEEFQKSTASIKATLFKFFTTVVKAEENPAAFA